MVCLIVSELEFSLVFLGDIDDLVKLIVRLAHEIIGAEGSSEEVDDGGRCKEEVYRFRPSVSHFVQLRSHASRESDGSEPHEIE